MIPGNLPTPNVPAALDALAATIRELPDVELLHLGHLLDGMVVGARDGGAPRSAGIFGALGRVVREHQGERVHTFRHVERELSDLDTREPQRWDEADGVTD